MSFKSEKIIVKWFLFNVFGMKEIVIEIVDVILWFVVVIGIFRIIG